ncbi:hypothetical protein Rvan_3280 [Rhodomicrobium vannielii ATCC 17100]|uniref:Uncharacterized protein n=1 Tax=Rhodomicrobium vannielii (strain ATCC 17100 / DSM 162 / LMG 4299 / NCIMB 10020 / ATH 3.1.1) TaxID=648757 RepID=E3I286_RHOVT|nr:hypothetical protein [Rhodomicrobium vannielii]ADP72473.1 hypothetical protein Rvan_3280 [Rhodomicrobium vannielii ATCC 17100]
MTFYFSRCGRLSYSDAMSEGTHYIELRLNLSQPAELLSLVGAFSALANQFEQFIKREHPPLEGRAKLYVQHIHASDIVLQLIPLVQNAIATMDSALIVDGFASRYGGWLSNLFEGKKHENATKSDLKDFMNQVAIIATDPNAKATLSSAVFHGTSSTSKAVLEFDTQQARRAEKIIDEHKREIDLKAYEVAENVLMVFYQSNLRNPDILKQTSEKAIIEAVSKKPLAIVYASEIAKERIKHEMMAGERNLYQLGFYVDVYVERLGGKPVAYRIAHVHDIIELPDD